nr:GNAT family N-acetyltransferase [Corynebacterium lactis]
MSTLTDKNGEAVEVFKDPEHGYFAIAYAGADSVAGYTQYLPMNGERVFFHTVIGEEYEGRGLASILIKKALEDTDAEGVPILAVCPFVSAWLKKHGEEFDGVWRLPNMDDLRAFQKVMQEAGI